MWLKFCGEERNSYFRNYLSSVCAPFGAFAFRQKKKPGKRGVVAAGIIPCRSVFGFFSGSFRGARFPFGWRGGVSADGCGNAFGWLPVLSRGGCFRFPRPSRRSAAPFSCGAAKASGSSAAAGPVQSIAVHRNAAAIFFPFILPASRRFPVFIISYFFHRAQFPVKFFAKFSI